MTVDQAQPGSATAAMVAYTQDSSLHGIQFVPRKELHIARRIMWGVAVIAGLSGLTTIFVTNMMRFMKKPTSTKIMVKYQRNLEFPAVTVCNLNAIRKSFIGNDTRSQDFLQAMYGPGRLKKTLNFSDPRYSFADVEGADWDAWREAAGHKWENMAWECYWRNNPISCTEYFTKTSTEIGICFTFNSGEFGKRNGSLTVDRTGSDNGLWLRLNIEQYEYFWGPSNSAGVKILLHNPDDIPLIKELGFAVSPGTENFVSIKQVHVKRLPPPFEGSVCVNTTDSAYKNKLKYFPKYSISACRSECKADFIIDKCKCRLGGMPGNVSVCDPETIIVCVPKAEEDYAAQSGNCECFDECEQTVYETALSFASYPASHLLDALQKLDPTITDDFAKKNYLEVRIFYEELNFDHIEEVPGYEGTQLFSDIGGQMGLCLGASLLTILELLEQLVLFFYRLLVRTKPRGATTIKVQPVGS